MNTNYLQDSRIRDQGLQNEIWRDMTEDSNSKFQD